MRSALLLLPVTTAVVATVGLTVAPAPFGSTSSGARPAAAVATVGPARTEHPLASAGAAAAHRTGPTSVGHLDTGSPGGTAPPEERRLRGRWAWPLAPRPAVLRPFVRPASRYGPGHRGIDLAGSTGQAVLAVDAGVVTHVGRIAGRGTVTVLHASGVRSTYEPVDATVAIGMAVAGGTPLGQLAASGSHCASVCLHLGAVRGRAYLDPLVFLVGGRRVRLLPLAQAPDG